MRRAWTRRLNLFAASRTRRYERVALAAEQLARIDQLHMIIAKAEVFAREILPCDDASISLTPFIAEVWDRETLRIPLPGPHGDRIGWMTASRRRGWPYSADDEAVFEHLARIVTLAVQAGLHSATVAVMAGERETLLSSLTEGVAQFDAGLRFLALNDAGARQLRLPHAGDALGRSLWDLAPGDRPGEFGALCRSASDTGRPISGTGHFPSLQTDFAVRAIPAADRLIVLFRDLMDQRERQDRLRPSSRLESAKRISLGVAHDLTNLLAVMAGSFETIGRHLRQLPPGDAAGGEVHGGLPAFDAALAGLRAAETAMSLTRRQIDAWEGRPTVPQWVDVAALLYAMKPLLENSAGRVVRLRLALASALWPVFVDPAELERAVLNLVLNARDAMPGGGALEITAANVEVDRLYARMAGLQRTGAFVMLSIADTGSGIPEEMLPRVFEPFVTTREPEREAALAGGLGLSIVQCCMRNAGGHVRIESEVGHGTTVHLYLPYAAPSVPAPLVRVQPPRPAEPGLYEHVFVVEDQPQILGHTAAMLRRLGYRVTTAADGQEALRILNQGLHPDLLFTDVLLPGGINGVALARQARAVRPDLPVLFTSGLADHAALREEGLMPWAVVLAKPFRAPDLARAVRGRIDAAKAGGESS